MADNTQILNPDPNIAGETLRTESLGGTPEIKVLAAKIHVGSAGQDAGPAIPGNGLPITSNGDVASVVSAGQKAVPTGTAEPLSGLSIPATRSVAVKAFNENTVNVFVGGAVVTIATGWQLGPGETVAIHINDASNVYVVAPTTNPVVVQKVSFLVL